MDAKHFDSKIEVKGHQSIHDFMNNHPLFNKERGENGFTYRLANIVHFEERDDQIHPMKHLYISNVKEADHE